MIPLIFTAALATHIVAPLVDSSTTGAIVMYRVKKGLISVGCPVRYKGHKLVELGQGKYFVWHVSPGRYIVNNKSSSLEITVAPGETQYVRCELKDGMYLKNADLQVVDKQSFDEKRAKLALIQVDPFPGADLKHVSP